MDLIVALDGAIWRATFGKNRWRCALGRTGVTADKQEGDGATPAGCWPLRRVLYRPDRLPAPDTTFPVAALTPDDGWCDDQEDMHYNQPVRLPYAARHEVLWREDEIYDAIVILAHNDDPPEPGKGSAIFLHVARGDYGPTEGCVSLALLDLLTVLREAGPNSRVCIEGSSA